MPKGGAPSYTSYSEHEKETLLSQLGSFTPVQRTLFHALCDTHKPEIPYRKFSEKMGMLVKNVQAELEALVTHLNRNKMGLFRCSYSDSEKKIESIILTEPGDIWFSIYSLTELCSTLIHGSAPTLPTLSLLKEEKLEIPDSFVTRVDLKQISKTYIQETVQSNAIAAVPMSSGETLFFVSSSLNSFIQLCIAVIRDVTGYGDILSELARFKNISLNEIKQQLGTKAPLAWLEITETIDSYAKKRGEKKEIQVRDGFFEAAELLRFYLANEVREAKEKKQEERELSADFQAILLRLKGEFKTPVPQATMDTILGGLKKKHGENFPEVSARFYSHYTKPEEKSALAAVIQAAGHYIHRDNSYRYIALRIREAGRKLHEEYLLTMIRSAEIKQQGGKPSVPFSGQF